jgi:hypothetical protein
VMRVTCKKMKEDGSKLLCSHPPCFHPGHVCVCVCV